MRRQKICLDLLRGLLAQLDIVGKVMTFGETWSFVMT